MTTKNFSDDLMPKCSLKSRVFFSKLALMVLLGFVLSGCSKKSAEPIVEPIVEPVPFGITATIKKTGSSGLSQVQALSPTKVIVYQLKAVGAFLDADYFDLLEEREEILGADLLSKKTQYLLSGRSETFDLKIDPDTHFLGAVSGFQDDQNTVWRTFVPLPLKRAYQHDAQIVVSDRSINIQLVKQAGEPLNAD